jgi:hypothetical protein
MFGWAMTVFLRRFLLGDIVLEASIMFHMLKAGAVVVIVGLLGPVPSSQALGALSSCWVVTSEWLDSRVVFYLVSFFSFSFFFVFELGAP